MVCRQKSFVAIALGFPPWRSDCRKRQSRALARAETLFLQRGRGAARRVATSRWGSRAGCRESLGSPLSPEAQLLRDEGILIDARFNLLGTVNQLCFRKIQCDQLCHSAVDRYGPPARRACCL